MDDEIGKSLLKRTLNGDKNAFNELSYAYRQLIYTIAYRFLGDRDDAMDICQDTLLTILQKGSQFKNKGSLEGWVRTIALNRCRNVARSKKRNPVDFGHEIEDDSEQDSSFCCAIFSNPEQSAISTQEGKKIDTCIRSLPEKQRATVIMKIYQELTLKEIANLMNCNLGTSKANFFHGLKKLKQCLESCNETLHLQ